MRLARTLFASLVVLPIACGTDDAPPASPSTDAGSEAAAPNDTDAGDAGDGDGSVSPVEAGSTTLTLTTYLNRTQANLPWVAFNDGEGPWTAVTGLGGTYTFTITTGRYGLAWGCHSMKYSTDVGEIYLVHATVAELPSLKAGCAVEPAAPVTVSGTIAGMATGDTGYLNAGESSTFPSGASPTYSLSTLESGTYDFLVARKPTVDPDRVILRRNEPITFTKTLDFDFASEGTDLSTFEMTITGASGTEVVTGGASLRSHLGSSVSLTGGGSATTYRALPAAALAQNDQQSAGASAVDAAAHTKRSVTKIFRTPAALTLALPPLFATPAVAVVATAPYARFKVDFASAPDADVYTFGLSRTASGLYRSWSIFLSPGWLGEATTHSYSVPDFSATAGWDTSSWGVGGSGGEAVNWAVGYRGFATNVPLSNLLASEQHPQPSYAAFIDNTDVAASVSGSVIP